MTAPSLRNLVALILVALVPCLGCLRPAQERAELDTQVGFADAGGVSFHVRDGLAAVRIAKPGTLVLWSQAPVLDLEVSSTPGATEQWTIQFLNSMPDSLLVPTSGGDDIRVEAMAPDRLAFNQFRVSLPEAAATVLHLAPEDADRPEPFSFAVMGDVQGAINDVGDIYAVMNADPTLRFVASTGDLSESGSGAQLDEVQQSLSSLGIPLYSTIGNHELGGDPLEWHGRFGRASFHWMFHGVHLSFVDSANAGIDPIVYDWLRDWLDQSRAASHLCFTHFPPFDPVGTRSGSFRDRNEAAMLVGLLVDGAVDATFHGHIHSYYAFSLGGIPAYISGGGGAIPERMDGIGRHYLRVTVDPATQVEDVAIVRVD